MNCEKLQQHHIKNLGNKDKICKNDYWRRLNNSWEESFQIRELLSSSPELSLLLMKYIGPAFCLSQYDYIYVPGNWDGSTTGSRGWHLDNHHMRVVKLFIPVHRITKEHGATCVMNPKYSRIYAKYHPFNMPDIEVYKIGTGCNSPIKVIEMSANDAFLIDTSRCLHMGGRSAKSRLFVVITFTGIASYCTNWPRNLIEPKVQQTLFDVNSSLGF